MASPRWPYYLPVNPCCTTVYTNPCVDTCTDPCKNYWSQSDHLAYTGPNLPCTDIDNCDTLTTVIQKIEAKICEILESIATTTTTTTI